ncbi:MAG TPA: TIM barrel protein, partial [Bryobacteraceae bacterium]|nr:TIM barrel protein [Bryobacteraceae bacterium]
VFAQAADILGEMAELCAREKVELLVENEAACNVATCTELAGLMKLLPQKSVGINWDPLNGFDRGEEPYPMGYSLLPKKRIGNVQVKGRSLLDPEKKLDWAAIKQALQNDGYPGKIGLETHYFDGTMFEKSHLCMQELVRLMEPS